MAVNTWDDLVELEKRKETKSTQNKDKNNLIIFDGNNFAYSFFNRSDYYDYAEPFLNKMYSISSSYGAKKIYVCFDSGYSEYRKSLYSEYKGRRTENETEEQKTKKELFFECLQEIITEHLEEEYFKFKGVEADDIICFLVENLKNKYDNIWIISSDKDMFQLLDNNVHIFSTTTRKEITLESLKEKYNCTPEEYMLHKIIAGEKGKSSDNIQGSKGIGEIRGIRLAKQYKTLQNLLNSIPIPIAGSKILAEVNKNAKLFILNEQLIDLKKFHEEAIKINDDCWITLNNLLTRECKND